MHGLVKSGRRAVLIINEARPCGKRHGFNAVWSIFDVPVRGLARAKSRNHGERNPSARAKALSEDLRQTAEKLDSLAESLSTQRSELVPHTRGPILRRIHCSDGSRTAGSVPLSDRLQDLIDNYDFTTDPYVLHLRELQQRDPEARTLPDIKIIIAEKETRCYKTLTRLANPKSPAGLAPLGREWGLLSRLKVMEAQLPLYKSWLPEERQHLEKLIANLMIQTSTASFDGLCRKLEELIDVIVSEYSTHFSGIVVVEDMDWATTVHKILSIHPRTKDILRTAPHIPHESSYRSWIGIGHESRMLADYRAGVFNLLVSTSIFHPAIDLSNCHLVVCFVPPNSVEMTDGLRGKLCYPPTWKATEPRAPEAHLKTVKEVRSVTGTKLAGKAVELPKLEQKVPQTMDEEDGGILQDVEGTGLPKAESNVHEADLEDVEGERIVKEMEAFDDEEENVLEGGEASHLVNGSPPYNPWIQVAEEQQRDPYTYHQVLLKTKNFELCPEGMVLLMPCAIPQMPELLFHWSETESFHVESSPLSTVTLDEKVLEVMRSITRKILSSASKGRWTEEVRNDFLWLLVPHSLSNDDACSAWDETRLREWEAQTTGQTPAIELLQQQRRCVRDWGLVSTGDPAHYIFQGMAEMDSEQSLEDRLRTSLQLVKLPSLPAFLGYLSVKARPRSFRPQDCMVSNLPAAYSIFGRFVPGIINECETGMRIAAAPKTVLAPLSLEQCHLLLGARPYAAQIVGNAFLGKAILKLYLALHHPSDTQSLKLNASLTRAATKEGFDKWIPDPPMGPDWTDWAPQMANDNLEDDQRGGHRQLRRSFVAHIMRALIGTSFSAGGFSGALAWMQKFSMIEPSRTFQIPTPPAPYTDDTGTALADLARIEAIVDYTFANNKRVLLVAIFHPSVSIAERRSFHWLAVVGDAVLDLVLTRTICQSNLKEELKLGSIDGILNCVVNADFLAWCMLEATASHTVIRGTKKQESQLRVRNKRPKTLWHFVRRPKGRHSAAQHNALRGPIRAALSSSPYFPWHLLSLPSYPKEYSDIMERIIGAVYVDSNGDVEACERAIRGLGILEVLEGMLTRGVSYLHPKPRLEILASKRKQRVEWRVVKAEGMPSRTTIPGRRRLPTRGGYTVQVKLDGKDIGRPVKGWTQSDALTAASWEALEILGANSGGGLENGPEEDMSERTPPTELAVTDKASQVGSENNMETELEEDLSDGPNLSAAITSEGHSADDAETVLIPTQEKRWSWRNEVSEMNPALCVGEGLENVDLVFEEEIPISLLADHHRTCRNIVWRQPDLQACLRSRRNRPRTVIRLRKFRNGDIGPFEYASSKMRVSQHRRT